MLRTGQKNTNRPWKILKIVTKNHEFPFCMIKADMFPYQNKTRILKKKTFFFCEKCTFWGEEITQNCYGYGREDDVGNIKEGPPDFYSWTVLKPTDYQMNKRGLFIFNF